MLEATTKAYGGPHRPRGRNPPRGRPAPRPTPTRLRAGRSDAAASTSARPCARRHGRLRAVLHHGGVAEDRRDSTSRLGSQRRRRRVPSPRARATTPHEFVAIGCDKLPPHSLHRRLRAHGRRGAAQVHCCRPRGRRSRDLQARGGAGRHLGWSCRPAAPVIQPRRGRSSRASPPLMLWRASSSRRSSSHVRSRRVDPLDDEQQVASRSNRTVPGRTCRDDGLYHGGSRSRRQGRRSSTLCALGGARGIDRSSRQEGSIGRRRFIDGFKPTDRPLAGFALARTRAHAALLLVIVLEGDALAQGGAGRYLGRSPRLRRAAAVVSFLGPHRQRAPLDTRGGRRGVPHCHRNAAPRTEDAPDGEKSPWRPSWSPGAAASLEKLTAAAAAPRSQSRHRSASPQRRPTP